MTETVNASEIFAQIAEQAGRDTLVFPSTTELALKVQRLLDDPDCSVDDLVKLMRADPLLSTRVVAVANSVAYNHSGKTISEVKNAVARIGFKALRVLAASVVVRQMQTMARTPEHRKMALNLWEHTAHVAALAQVLARRVTKVDPDTAFFAGIIHEVGGFYLISRADKFPGLLEGGSGSLMEWEDGGAAVVGRAVLQRLEAPAPVMGAIEAMWSGFLEMPPKSLADTLLLADQLSPVESPLSQLSGIVRGDREAHLEVMMDDATLSSILEESAEEVTSLTQALRG